MVCLFWKFADSPYPNKTFKHFRCHGYFRWIYMYGTQIDRQLNNISMSKIMRLKISYINIMHTSEEDTFKNYVLVWMSLSYA